MYHCHLTVCFLGLPCPTFDIVRTMPPLEHFTHEFLEARTPEDAMEIHADMILVNLQGLDAGTVSEQLTGKKHKEAQLVFLAERDQVALFSESFSEIRDIWILPMSEDEIRFRFLRWQQDCKRDKDYWQVSQYLERTINSIPSLIWYKDKEGIHEKVNDSFCATVNKSREQVEGRDHYYIWDVDPDEAGTDCMDSDMEAMRKQETCVSEELVETGDGTRLMTTYKSPLYDVDGTVMGTVGVGIDVTQERAYEQEIVNTNQMLELIFTSLDCGILVHTLDGKHIVRCNRAALNILGYETQEEMMEAGFDMVADSVLDEDKKKLRESIATLQTEGDSVSVEYRVQHSVDDIRHVMGNVKLLHENGKIFYRRFLLDVTAQKLEEKKNEQRQTELVQALSIDYNVVCFFELTTEIGIPLRLGNTGNRIFESFFSGEKTFRECMDRYIEEIVYEEDREMLRRVSSWETMKEELSEKKFYVTNFRILKDGGIEYYEMKIVRAGIWGESHGVVLGFRSVDEETRSEMEQKTLLEEALIQANRANEAKSAFLSNMSHDIRTPMNAIVGFAALATAHIDSKERVEDYLGKIADSGNHLLGLINDVLDMSRIESGKMQLEENPCSLSDVLRELRHIIQVDVQAKQLDFTMDTSGIRNGEVFCDKRRLNQVLLNVLSNAVKYTHQGGSICLKVKEKENTSEGYATFTFFVKDNGIGISKEFLEHIFEPFEREENTTMSGIQGTGLGMAITKNIVNMMNGTIRVESEQGKGTEVTLSFTFRLNLEPAQPQVQPAEVVKPHVERILLVEDNELNQEIAVTILEDAGIQTEVAANGRIAVDMIKNSEPGYYELVLMDVQMPVMNGYEATREIRKLSDPGLASVPILAMTANVLAEDRQKALECGMNGHIAKPIDVGKLFSTLQKALS